MKARAVSRKTLPNNESNTSIEDRLVLNLTYHPLLRDFQKILNEAQRRTTNIKLFLGRSLP